MQAGFVERETCPLCRSAGQSCLSELGYDNAELAAFIERFYGGRVAPSQLSAGSFRVVSCRQCGFIYQDPILDDVAMGRLYEEWVDQDASLHKKKNAGAGLYRQYAGQMQTLLRIFDRPPRQTRVLDFGMGWGYWCRMAQAHGLAVSGLEASPRRREYAQRWGFTVLEALDPAAGKFDFINANQVFEHLADPAATLRDLCLCLNEGGIVSIRVPDGRGVERRLRGRGWSPDIDAVHPLEHINCFTRDSLLRLAGSAGLRLYRPPLRLNWGSLASGIRREISDRWFNTQMMFRR